MQDQAVSTYLLSLLNAALREDQADQCATSRALDLDSPVAIGSFLIKESGVIAGFRLLENLSNLPWLKAHDRFAPKLVLHAKDGDEVKKGTVVATLEGSAGVLLRLERSMLNLISHLSGVATLTKRYVEACKPNKVKICDTRKTLVGLRLPEKYAVKCGGGVNHRFNLADQAMIKENHLALSGKTIPEAIALIREQEKDVRLTCECETLAEVQSALEAGADCVLLDNFSLVQLIQAVSLRRSLGFEKIPFEASGGVTLNTVAGIAATGVERISVGALTHSAPSLDISFKIKLVEE